MRSNGHQLWGAALRSLIGACVFFSGTSLAQIPTAPTHLVATGTASTEIILTWTDTSNNESLFKIERSTGSGAFTLRSTVGANSTSYKDTGLASLTTYAYRVYAWNIYGGSAYTNQASATTLAPGQSAPTAPTELTATAVSATQINLNWTASLGSFTVTGYRVERCQGLFCTFAQVATTTATSFSDANLTASTTYRYRVRAVDAVGGVGSYSPIASATTQAADTTAPTAPGGLTANSVSVGQINLSWTASTDNVGVTGYQVDRCQGAGCATFAQVATPTGTSFNDTGLAPSTSYSYRVRATDAAGNISANSSIVTATTQAPPDTTAPTVPTGLTATVASTIQINLTWTASTDDVGVTGYRVERCQGAGCTTFAQIATPTATSFSNIGLSAATSYSYRVRATDAAGNLSAYSNVASATTADATQVQAYYIHPDHLNTPRMIADQAGNTVWRWDNQEPFGSDLPNDDPGNTGNPFVFNLRFPGQYFDRETNLAYNYFRDYDSSIGRYVQSDPIGLRGGINTYAYTNANPIFSTDSTGNGPIGLVAATVCVAYDIYDIVHTATELAKLSDEIAKINKQKDELEKTCPAPGEQGYVDTMKQINELNKQGLEKILELTKAQLWGYIPNIAMGFLCAALVAVPF